MNHELHRRPIRTLLLGQLALLFLTIHSLIGQETQPEKATVGASIGDDGTGKITVDVRGELPKPPPFYTASASGTATIGLERIVQKIKLTFRSIQGEPERYIFGLRGAGEVTSVEGDSVKSWAVRSEDGARFLELRMKGEAGTEYSPTITIRSKEIELPAAIDLTHLDPGKAVGFRSFITLKYAPGVDGKVTLAEGFLPIDAEGDPNRFQTTTGGRLNLTLARSGALAGPIELTNTRLKGELDAQDRSGSFQLTAKAIVTEADTAITILRGNAAASAAPSGAPYQLRLAPAGKGPPAYELVFEKPGTYSIALDFVAVIASKAEWKSMDFTVAAGAVAPFNLTGIEPDSEFRAGASVVPRQRGPRAPTWEGFIPASGHCSLAWKSSRKIGEGKLFFTTTAKIETTVSAGLLRQDHQVDYKVLQGELDELKLLLEGPGEVLDVSGDNVVAWTVSGAGDARTLTAKLSQAITESSRLAVRTQNPLDAFPVRAEALRLTPVGAVRHSGHIRLSNQGSVRLEPTGLTGLTQLAPEQFPGEALAARQVFVYRFPAAAHAYEIAADRIQPEVNISELVIYELAETDRVVRADIEFDIREAPVREWTLQLPSDYSVVSVTGASVGDYIVGTEVEDGRRNLVIIFGQDVSGRQLVNLHLEKNEAAAAGDWILPRLEFPGAKSVRGDIGIVGAPGFRIAVGETDLLVEKPLSYFPKPLPYLQQAFRIREPGWSATMQIELLEKSVQADAFHLYSLSEGNAYGSVLLNYFITGAPVSEWEITVPEDLGNVVVDGQDVRTWRRDGENLIVSLHQPVIGPYTLLVTFEEKLDSNGDLLSPGRVTPLGVQGERGYVQIVSPMQVSAKATTVSEGLLELDPLELPAEFRLLNSAPPLGTWQYTERPFTLELDVQWFIPGTTATQVVEFSEVSSRISPDGEVVTNLLYYVKSRGRRALMVELPEDARLWEVKVAGQSVTARQDGNATLIPLPGGTDPNHPIEVRLRLGKAGNGSRALLALPVISAPVLKTEWNVSGDEGQVVIPAGGTVDPPAPVLRPYGFNWVAKRGIAQLFTIGALAGIGIWMSRKKGFLRVAGIAALAMAALIALVTAMDAGSQTGSPAPLRISLPILTAGEAVELQVRSVPTWMANASILGSLFLVIGLGALAWSFTPLSTDRDRHRAGGILLLAIGILLQRDSAGWFFLLLAAAIAIFFFLPRARDGFNDLKSAWSKRREARRKKKEKPIEPGAATASLLIGALLLGGGLQSSHADAVIPDGFKAADSIVQELKILDEEDRLHASGTITLSGSPGDRFLLVKNPAVLTSFEGEGLRLAVQDVPGHGVGYVISIPAAVTAALRSPQGEERAASNNAESATFEASFAFEFEVLNVATGFPVLTGPAAVQEIQASYDQPGWEFESTAAVSITPSFPAVRSPEGEEWSAATLLLAPREKSSITLVPKARDVTAEDTQFFIEGSNLYLPGPGVVDGAHRIHVRPSQGQVEALAIDVPEGLTVSEVSGPVPSWQFDADTRVLKIEIAPAQARAFDILINTQRGLDPLPAEVTLAPLTVNGAAGEVGLVALAFGPDAQPEKTESDTMSVVNIGDFDASLLPGDDAVLHRVYRYGAEGGDLQLRVTSVAPEVRVTSTQVLSLGDERIVLGVTFTAEITRAGLFQLSFPLPDGLEVESLTGSALHHWAELSEGGQRRIILHLNGKTIGAQDFSLSLAGPAPDGTADWEIPRFDLSEATRQTGDLVVKPTTGIRLRTLTRQNVSEVDPRTLGGQAQGALAFRLLQGDWNLVLGIEKLDPWITGQLLHEITLREGQTRTALIGRFNVQNASIRTLQVALPVTDEDEIKTLRASGPAVSDLIRTAPESNLWEIQFKRRVVGDVEVRIEFERRGDRSGETEILRTTGFPEARQLTYYCAVRAGGRLELELGEFPRGWQRADWTGVPQALRDAGDRNAPTLTLRAISPEEDLAISVKRHSLAESLKLRVANGSLTTVLSPLGDQLTAVDLRMEVIQRSSLTVGLPADGLLFNIFVNGESVHSVRQGDAWQFYILPGADDRTASVRFVYSVPGDRLRKLGISSPQLNVPLENIQWHVVAPQGFVMTDDKGNLELERQENWRTYDRDSYLSKSKGLREAEARQAAQLLDQANQLLQAGEQKKANWALNSVANRYALDAASNEDARVQLENLQTQQAIVGLNTRRQRVLTENRINMPVFQEDEQVTQGITSNRVLQDNDLNYRPQELGQLLQGNTSEDNAVLQQIAGRLVKHQRTTMPAPQAIAITLPEEGTVYTFKRTVSVAENAPLELTLWFASTQSLALWRTALVLVLLTAFSGLLAQHRGFRFKS